MKSTDLSNLGFNSWTLFSTDSLHLIAESPGVYVLRMTGGAVFGRLKGDSDILYIGSSEASLRKRLGFYHNPGPTQWTSIRINKMLSKYSMELSWIPHSQPRTLEAGLIQAYLDHHDELPPFNAQSGQSKSQENDSKTPSDRKGNRDKILEIVKEVPEGLCDDCISSRTGIAPRQQVNSIASSLARLDQITRPKDRCVGCGVRKIVNRPY